MCPLHSYNLDTCLRVNIISCMPTHVLSVFLPPQPKILYETLNLLVLQDQITEVIEYARSYLSIETEAYHKVWYKLHVCPDASRWKDILILCELCFSLPFSNGRVERIFLSMKLIKTDRRTRLKQDTGA